MAEHIADRHLGQLGGLMNNVDRVGRKFPPENVDLVKMLGALSFCFMAASSGIIIH